MSDPNELEQQLAKKKVNELNMQLKQETQHIQ